MRLVSADKLRKAMEFRDMTWGRLARYAGCDKSMIGHLLAGRRSTCTPQLAARISEALDFPIEDLFVPSVSETDGSMVRARQTRIPA